MKFEITGGPDQMGKDQFIGKMQFQNNRIRMTRFWIPGQPQDIQKVRPERLLFWEAEKLLHVRPPLHLS